MNAESGLLMNAITELNAVCRFCGEQSLKSIDIHSEDGLQNDIPNKIELYLPVEISKSDTLPSKCCCECVGAILTWHKFVQKALETTQKLKDLNEKLKIIPTDIEKTGNEDAALPCSTSLYAFYSKVDNNLFKTESTKYKLEEKCADAEDADVDADVDTDSYMEIQNCSDIHKENDGTKNDSIQAENCDKITYTCFICSEIFSSEEQMLKHKSDAHPDVSDIEDGQSKMTNKGRRIRTKIDPKVINEAKVIVDDRVYYNCKVCGKSLLSPYTYIWHIRIHTGERPFVCDLCGKQFRVSQGLVRHLKETHERIKNFSCDICGRMFATKRNVDEHRRIHTNERPYICALCGKAFKQKASLFVHNRTHSDTFPYKCEYCNQGFRTKPPLLIHITKHTGQKPYPCDVCGRCFRIKYELKRHTLVHSEEKPFSCTFCALRFKQKRYLMNHFKANHLNTLRGSVL